MHRCSVEARQSCWTLTCHHSQPCTYKHVINKQVMWLVITELRSASFGSVLHVQYMFLNSVNFLVTWGLSVTSFHSTCIFCVYGMALYWPTLQFYTYACTYCWPVRGAPWWVLLQDSNMLWRLFFIVECGTARFLCAMRVFKVRASSSFPRPPSCQISFISQPPLLS